MTVEVKTGRSGECGMAFPSSTALLGGLPGRGGDAGRTCPFSALAVIADHAGPLALTSRPPEHPCAHPRPLAGAPYSVTVTPDESLDCTGYWAVQLVVNNVNQMTAVNLVWSEP